MKESQQPYDILLLNPNRGGKFFLALGGLCFLLICALYQFSSMFVDVPMSHFNASDYRILQTFLDVSYSNETTDTGEVMDQRLLVDKSRNWSEDDLLEDAQKEVPSLPVIHWRHKPIGFNKSCARFPSMYDLEFSNVYWQTLRTSNGTFQLYGAYLDDRANNKLGPTVRILGMINRIAPRVVTFCQFWFDDMKVPALAKSFEYTYVWNNGWGTHRQGMYQPYLIACVLPEKFQNRTPQAISLVEKQCDTPTNILKVAYDKPEDKKDFAVCVKGLDFPHADLSVRLIEWIELLKLLGAEKIFFYQLQVHPNITRVLSYYEEEGTVSVTPTNLAGGQPNALPLQHLYISKRLSEKRLNELVPYNDCFYRHMYEYKFIALLDIDEVIVPVNGTTWTELMDQIQPKALNMSKEERGSYNARNIYFLDDLVHDDEFFDDIPRYMYMLQHVYHTKDFNKPGVNIKSFHNTEMVLATVPR